MKERIQRYNSLYDQASSIQLEIERIREQLVKIDNQLDLFATEENAPGMIEISSYARYPEMPDHSNEVTRATELKLGPFVFDKIESPRGHAIVDRGPYELDNGAIYHG